MTTRKITMMALIAGIVLGAAATEGFNVYRQSHDSQIFQERLRCKSVADAYVKENSTDPEPVLLTLDKVDYSPARNSCVVQLEKAYPGLKLTSDNVEDLLSGEGLFSATCSDNCGPDRLTFTDDAFDYVMNHTSRPIAIEKAWVASTALPTSVPPSGDRKPSSGFIPDSSKYPPKSAPPSGR